MLRTSTRLLHASCLAAYLTACSGSGHAPSPAPTEVVLHSFAGGSDGANPSARLVQGSDGTFYGTTVNGGDARSGIVFTVTPNDVVQTLYPFSFGANPEEAVIQATDGDLYGTTRNGGSHGRGTVFKIDAAGVKTVLHSFGNGADGANPIAAVIQATDGSFYGTTYYGGASGEGTIFKITAAGNLTTIHSFAGGTDGANPAAGLIEGADGNLYGTTYYGGGVTDCGTVFRITPAGTESALHSFTCGDDGAYVDVGLVQGSDGILYGVTAGGGAGGVGTVFAITTAGELTTLHSFAGGEDGASPADGANPSSRLIEAEDGSLYGTTFIGGANEVGTIYRISRSGDYAVVHSFGAVETGPMYPDSALVQSSDGDFYGTTEFGGDNGLGTVYRVSF